MQVQFRLLETQWPASVLAMRDCGERRAADGRLLFAGLRVRMAAFWAAPGSVVALLNPQSRTLTLRGPGMDAAVAVSDAAAGGQVLITRAVWQRVRRLSVPVDTCDRPLPRSQDWRLRCGGGCTRSGWLQVQHALPEAGFPGVAHLGKYQLPNGAYCGDLYELRGHAYKRLERPFPSPQKAVCLAAPRCLHARLPSALRRRLAAQEAAAEREVAVGAAAGVPLALVLCTMPLHVPKQGAPEVRALVATREI